MLRVKSSRPEIKPWEMSVIREWVKEELAKEAKKGQLA